MQNITHNPQTRHIVDTPGEQIFVFEDKTGVVEFIIDHPEADVKIYGTYNLKGNEKHVLEIKQSHRAPGSRSKCVIKNVLRGNSGIKIMGTIRVEKTAAESESSFISQSLVLDEKCFVDARPQLEILTNDVKCSHAATISRVSPEEIAFLCSRGVNKEEAENILTEGFLEEVSGVSL